MKTKDAPTLQLNYQDFVLKKFEEAERHKEERSDQGSPTKTTLEPNLAKSKSPLPPSPPPPSSNRFTAIIERIEKMYTGEDKDFHEGYDLSDPFIDSEDEIKLEEEEEEETFYGGFFINKGKTIQIRKEKKEKKRRREGLHFRVNPNVNREQITG